MTWTDVVWWEFVKHFKLTRAICWLLQIIEAWKRVQKSWLETFFSCITLFSQDIFSSHVKSSQNHENACFFVFPLRDFMCSVNPHFYFFLKTYLSRNPFYIALSEFPCRVTILPYFLRFMTPPPPFFPPTPCPLYVLITGFWHCTVCSLLYGCASSFSETCTKNGEVTEYLKK